MSTSPPATPWGDVLRNPQIGLILLVCLAAAGCSGFAASGLNAEGVRQFEMAQYEGALGQFQQAIFNDPNNADGYYNLAATYHRLGTLHGRQSDLDQAEGLYHQCLDRDPNHQECYRGLAVLLVQENRSPQAFRLLQGWADRSPALPAPKVELARLYEESGDRLTARDQLVAALTIEPSNSRALAALGRIREQMGQSIQALADYQRSLWYDSSQTELAARVATLQSAQVATSPAALTPVEGARTAMRNLGTFR